MTREEAIEELERLLSHWDDLENGKRSFRWYSKDAVEVALTALRPVSREQVEKVWRGEWVPAESDFDDDDTLFDVNDWCDWQCSACHNEVCYDDPMERRWLPKFCPNCGAPMTDEAVDMMLERWRALYD